MRRSKKTRRGLRFPDVVTGIGIGAGLAYVLDAELGKRRRSLIRDQFVHLARKSVKAADATVRDLRHRAYGSYAELRSALKVDDAPDEVLIARVRSRMGRYVAHPSLIDITALNGRITLKGMILEDEEPGLLWAVQSVQGVRGVENLLEVHSRSENVPELQGSSHRGGEPPEFMQKNWSPTARLIAGTAGWVLMANGLKRRNPAAFLAGTCGVGLLLRALTNTETKRLLGMAPERVGIDLQKTVAIDVPVERAFSLLASPENYPRFTETIAAVRKIENNRYEKRIRGPMGTEIHLDEIVTRSVPYELLAWESGPNSDVTYAGSARFEPTSENGTRVHLRFTYNPPGGILGHVAARLTGFDPKSLWDDVFMRAKTYLETGRQPHDAAERVTPQIHNPPAENASGI